MSPENVLENLAARGLLLELEARGVRLLVRRGNLAAKAHERLNDADRAALVRHKRDLLLLVLLCDERTLDRLAALWRGSGCPQTLLAPGTCYSCGELLPEHRTTGRCGFCALAARLYAGAPVPPDALWLFGEELAGALPVPQPAALLPLDSRIPA